jgi:hypothetical protein
MQWKTSAGMAGFWLFSFMPVLGQAPIAVNISGVVTDSTGVPVSAATVKLEQLGLTATTAANGAFTLGSAVSNLSPWLDRQAVMQVREGSLFLELAEPNRVVITAFGLQGQVFGKIERLLESGSRALKLPSVPSGVCFFKVETGHETGRQVSLISALAVDGELRQVARVQEKVVSEAANQGLAKRSAEPLYDVVTVTKSGFQKAYVSVSTSEISNMNIKLLKEGATKFSFFVTSMRTLQELAGTNGFGGDLRYGETGPGAGLRGADKICATIAEKSLPGSSVKGWRAFLSVTADAAGKPVNAIDRVGPGPWYDRTGRLLAPTKADLANVRPQNGDPTIQNDVPNEFGVPNHAPLGTQEDNHHMITGSTATGTLKAATSSNPSTTCLDWTSKENVATNGKPSSGFAWPRGGMVGSSGSNWITTWDAPGCAAGIEIVNGGGPTQQASQGRWIGGGGGYGGFYCFALNP